MKEQYSCVRVCVWAKKCLSAHVGFFSFFLCPARFIKLCIIYDRDLKSPITVFLTGIFHESLDENCFSIDLVVRGVRGLPLQAAEMEQGMWKRFKILILYMLYIMQIYNKLHIEPTLVASELISHSAELST